MLDVGTFAVGLMIGILLTLALQNIKLCILAVKCPKGWLHDFPPAERWGIRFEVVYCRKCGKGKLITSANIDDRDLNIPYGDESESRTR